MGELLDNLTTLFADGVRLSWTAEPSLLARYAVFFGVCVLVLWLVVARTRLRMKWPQRIVLTVLRTLVVAALILALVDVTQTTYRRALAVAFLVDVSESIPDEMLESARALLERAEQIKGDAEVRLATFAAEPRPTGRPDEVGRLDGRVETNIQNALHASYDLFPKGYTGRVVVLTDGNQTHGDLEAEAEVARDRGVSVSFVPLQNRIVRDAYVQAINLPRRARTGEEIVVSARIVSNHAAPAEVRLLRGGRVIERRKVELGLGESRQEFTTTAVGRGVATYVVRIATEGDEVADNDAMSGRIEVLGRPRVLLVTGRPEGDEALVAALAESGIEIQPAPAEAFPTRIGELNYFDLVLLSDVRPADLDQKAVDLLSEYLRDYGGGLLVAGGEATAELGKESVFPLEAVLPVKFKEKKKTEPNPIAMMIVLDKSNSMGRENKFGMAIRASKDAIAELPARSKAGVVVFDDRPYLTVPPTDVENREQIEAKLDTLGVDGGTSIYPALELAYHKIRRLPNTVRHVILLSDGYSNSRYQQNVRLIEEFRKKKITITTVGLGKECDPRHLRTVAEEGGGRFYHVLNAEDIPKIFIKETKRVTRTNVVEKKFKPTVVKSPELIAGIDFARAPELAGYNSSDPKPSSETFVLADQKEPLLSRWRVGLGRVVVFASDTGGPWASDWPAWDQYAEFWTRLVRGTLRDLNLQVFRVRAEPEGRVARLEVDAADTRGNFLNNLDLSVRVTDPDGNEQEVALRQDRPGGYGGTFPLSTYGSYAIRVRPTIEGTLASETFSRFNLAPPSEFVHPGPNEALMRRAAQITGGWYDPSLEQVFAPADENFPEDNPLWPYLVLAALALYMVNLFVRRT